MEQEVFWSVPICFCFSHFFLSCKIEQTYRNTHVINVYFWLFLQKFLCDSPPTKLKKKDKGFAEPQKFSNQDWLQGTISWALVQGLALSRVPAWLKALLLHLEIPNKFWTRDSVFAPQIMQLFLSPTLILQNIQMCTSPLSAKPLFFIFFIDYSLIAHAWTK